MFDRRQFLKLLGILPFAPAFTLLSTQPVTPAAERTIDLVDFHIAGFQYHQGTKARVMTLLTTGTVVSLVREPGNPYDDKAIAIVTLGGAHIGYIPRDLNRIPAAMLDQQIPLRATITAITPEAPAWERVRVAVRQVI